MLTPLGSPKPETRSPNPEVLGLKPGPRIKLRRTPPDGTDEGDDDDLDDAGSQQESIRDLQRRRRNASRARAGIEAILARPQEDDEEDGEGESGPAPTRVFVVFRGAKWSDPDGALRESDSIAGIYGTEAAAKKAADALSKAESEQDDAWYQSYPVQE